MKTKEWFLEKVGQRIYRDYHKCCQTCDMIAENGLIVCDNDHADYLYEIQCAFFDDGLDLHYRDEK